ncbi:MAG: glycoside hydrolase family 6 protein [Solirubrobacteraceae bacterium]
MRCRHLVLPTALLALLAAAPAAQAAVTTVPAESLTISSRAGVDYADATADGGSAALIWSNGSASGPVTTRAARRISVRAKGDQCSGAPHMVVAVDGRTVLDVTVPVTTWTAYAADAALPDGAHTLSVRFTNDASTSACDRNLRVDSITFTSTAADPFGGRRFYVDPASNAQAQADAWRSMRPADAAEMDKIAAQPQALWLTGGEADVAGTVRTRTDAAAAAGTVPVFVAYAIPQRDCGSYSAGGASSASAYATWIRAVAAGIGTRRAAVILEPDSLAGMDCLSAADRDSRLAILRDAVAALAANPGTSVYLDGGHPGWQTASEMAGRLVAAGAADAQGFALNVSNFVADADNASYGTQVAAAAGGKHFVVDTSRNGLGPAPDGAWCNPSGRALGARPTSTPGVWRQDASLWIKRPGESDGTCQGGPSAGTWWADYALGLAQRAAY